MARISEHQLILPSLFLMSIAPQQSITTSNLIVKLTDILKPLGEDLVILSGRNDTKFSQKVRNLKAHDTFERYGFAKYNKGFFTITKKGEKHLADNMDAIRYILINDFKWDDIKDGLEWVYTKNKEKKKIEIFDENISIQEGIKKIVEVNVYERSNKLRDIAIDYYTTDGKINCKACNFNFEKFYGTDIGKRYIEIHHTKPIFKYEDEDLNQVITNALRNVAPVCSNCHRMIHRNWSKPLELSYLIRQISLYGSFSH